MDWAGHECLCPETCLFCKEKLKLWKNIQTHRQMIKKCIEKEEKMDEKLWKKWFEEGLVTRKDPNFPINMQQFYYNK